MHSSRHLVPALFVLGTLCVPAAAQQDNSYAVHNLDSDGGVPALHLNSNLVNSWGITHSPTSPWWVANADTGTSTLFNGAGTALSLVVTVPGEPTGIVSNGGSGFIVDDGNNHSGPAAFLFASEDGTISGWNSNVPPPMPSTQAFVVVDNSGSEASYKGLAISSTNTRIYAADFHHARVDAFDMLYTPILAGAFVDPGIPAGFAPFGIQTLEGNIYVAYAMQDAAGEDEVTGPGLGYVSVFDPDGNFIARVASNGPLNAPWGMTIAPEGFGRFSGMLLVGNFGDGRINAFDLSTFEHKGHLKLANHHPLVVDGLWGIGFGNGANAGPTTTLFFAAGPDDEEHGVFGSITFEGE
jgi:uncharacterized protein (TIGR03118 family)